MGIDKDTKPTFAITIEDSNKYLNALKEYANDQGYNDEIEDGENKSLLLDDSVSNVSTEEYYFDSREEIIHYTGSVEGFGGKSNIYFEIPLSDTVLIDILEHSLKKLSKLKTAMEFLK